MSAVIVFETCSGDRERKKERKKRVKNSIRN
jgi:hypothetical protein